MSIDDRELHRAIEDLSRRLERVEAQLGIEPPRVPATSPARVAERPSAPPVAPASSTPPPQAEAGAGGAVAAPSPTLPVAPPATLPAPPPRRPSDLLPVPAALAPTAPARPDRSLEWLLGGKLFAIGAALLLIVGAGMGLKFGIDRGWFRVSPEARCIAAALAGLALIGGGQWVRRAFGRAGEIAAAASGAAGLAIIYGAAYASYGLYGLVPMSAAFGLLAVVSAGGIALGLLTRSLPMAALALVGAYLNPILMGESDAPAAIGPAYVTAVLVAGLALAGWRPDPFRWLRAVARWGVLIVGSVTVASISDAHPLLAIGCVALWWALVHAELVVGPGRLSEGAPVPRGASSPGVRVAAPAVASLGFTLWAVGLAEIVLATTDAHPGVWPWMITAAWTAATLAMALVLAGNLRVLRDPPETDRERLGVVLFGQCAALLIATVALGLSNWTQTLAWLAMGLGVVAAGRWMRSSLLDGYGVALLAIAAGRLVLWDSWNAPPGGAAALGVPLDRWTALMVGGGAAWLGAAWLLHRSGALTEEGTPAVGGGPEGRARAACVSVALAVAMTLLAGCAVRRSAGSAAIVLAPALLAVAAAWTAGARRSLGLGLYAGAAFALSAVVWGGRYLAAQEWGDLAAAPLMHPGLWLALGAAATAVAAGAALVRPAAWRGRAVGVALFWAGAALALGATSLELARSASVVFSDRMVQGAAVSCWWGILGMGAVAAGFAVSRPSVRWAGLALLGAAAVKSVFLDLADVSQGWRIVSFLGLGVLMLAVAVGYARVASRVERRTAGDVP